LEPEAPALEGVTATAPGVGVRSPPLVPPCEEEEWSYQSD
jgi:hypothetical protein